MLKDTFPLVEKYSCTVFIVGPEGPCSNAMKGRKQRPVIHGGRGGEKYYFSSEPNSSILTGQTQQ